LLTHSNHLGTHLDGEIHFFTAGKDTAEIIHAECIGGDIDLMVNRRATIGFFPWRFVDGESSIGRCVPWSKTTGTRDG
jgi:kynurenine formamidase